LRKPEFIKEVAMAIITPNNKTLLIGCGLFLSECIVIVEETGE
jgi:hypothetical protein